MPVPVPDPERRVFYSPDYTRVVEIVGEGREAFLYDMTTETPSQGQWLAAGIYDVRFVMEEGVGENAPPVLGQIELAFAGPTDRAVVDINGERKVVVSGPLREAVLMSLEDDTLGPLFLGQNVIDVVMVNEDGVGENPRRALAQIELAYADTTDRAVIDVNGERKVMISGASQNAILTHLRDGSPVSVYLGSFVVQVLMLNEEGTLKYIEVVMKVAEQETRVLFTRDGLVPTFDPVPEAPVPGGAAERMKSSPAFQSLNSGDLGW